MEPKLKEVRNPGLVVDGKVDWAVFEQVIIDNPYMTMFEMFCLDEIKVIFAKENSHDYYVHLGNALNRKRGLTQNVG